MMYNKNDATSEFGKVVAFAGECVDLLITYQDCFRYMDYGDNGNSCWKPYQENQSSMLETNLLIGAVRQAMPKFGTRHKQLSSAFALELSVKQISYDWLCKATARILSGIADSDEIKEMGEFSKNVRKRMQDKGLTTISSLADLN